MNDTTSKHTKASIIAMLMTSAYAVERALLCLLALQTDEEKASEVTIHRNGQGFNSRDAEFYTSLAMRVQSSRRSNGDRLSVNMLAALRRKNGITKYWAQLLRVAQEKEAARSNETVMSATRLAYVAKNYADQYRTQEYGPLAV